MNESAPAVYVHRPFWQDVMVQALAGIVAGIIIYVLTRK